MDLSALLSESNTNATNITFRLPFTNALHENNFSRFFSDLLMDEFNVLSATQTQQVPEVNRDEVIMRFQMGMGIGLDSMFNTQPDSSVLPATNSSENPVPYVSVQMYPLPLAMNWLPLGSSTTRIRMDQQKIDQCSSKVLITEPSECHICLDTLLPGSCMRCLSVCNHRYCIDCIDPWLKHHNTCPVCKQNVEHWLRQ